MTRPSPAQRAAIGRQYPGLLLLFRSGDAHEAHEGDAGVVARCCDLPCAETADGPMVRVEDRALSACVGCLLAAGHRVALCEPVPGIAIGGDGASPGRRSERPPLDAGGEPAGEASPGGVPRGQARQLSLW